MDTMNSKEDMMQYLLIGLLLLFGYFCLYRMFFRRNVKKSVLPIAASILFIVYAVVSAGLIAVFNQYGSLRMTLLMLLILMSMTGFCILIFGLMKNWQEIRKLHLLIFILYLAAISYGTIFGREERNKTVILLEFESIAQAIEQQSLEPLEHLLMNVGLFIPIGFLFVSMYPEKLNKISLVIPLGLMLTVLIETVQMMLQLGQCDLEDLLANALGAVLGVICYRMYRKLQLKKPEQD